MLIRALRFIVSILLIPVSIAFTISFYSGISSIKTVSESGLVFILGAFSYSILHLLIIKLDFLYVSVHELTHAIATLFSGGKVRKIKIRAKEGSVKTTKANIFVMLAPYLIPGYTLFIAFLYFGLSFFMDTARYSDLFIFIIGFTLMFHLAYTADSIRGKQSDLIKTGYLFSIFSIYIVNLVVIFFIINLLFKEAIFLDFISGAYEKSKDFYYFSWRQLFL
ncbi:MAG: M50 family metallopeptidase [Candidatus Omnitrophica bacterium]|nr:M50 family metallopeptidase [Candidatus Omnitrophota bacterium]